MPSSPRLRADPLKGERDISIDDWTVTTTKRPILSIPQADAASAKLDLALPEICFGNNSLAIHHHPSGFSLEWNTLDMLAAVKKGDGWDSLPGAGAVRVAHADEWSRGQAASGSTTDLTVQKPFDWTYTTLHRGRITSPPTSSTSSPALEPGWLPAPPSHPGIPLALLARTDIPILFFDEVPLFEDELGDNGIADVTVRVRVNHLSLFVLSRFALRIDGVLFRQFDVRLFHAFGSGELVREVKGREAPYAAVKARLTGSSSGGGSSAGAGAGAQLHTQRAPAAARSPSSLAALRTPYATSAAPAGRTASFPPGGSGGASSAPSLDAGSPAAAAAADLTPLTDINWVARVLDELALEEGLGGMSVRGEGRASRGGGGEGRWEGLGTRLEVMRAPWAARGGEGEAVPVSRAQ
ncbi:hypothetical protein JCM9279_004306 [Rhodotorula babjevae]